MLFGVGWPSLLAGFLASAALLTACKTDPAPPSVADGSVQTDAGPFFGSVSLPVLASPQPNFFDVWGTSPNEVFLVGERGTVLRSDGETFFLEPTPITDDLRGVWGFVRPDPMGGPDVLELYAVGNNGAIIHRGEMGEWSTELSPTGNDLRAVRGRPNGRIWAVGIDGTMITKDLRMPGGSWTTVMLPTQETIHGLWIEENGAAGVAVGNLGLVLRLQPDQTWTRQRIDGLSIPLQGVWGVAADRVWIVGLDGTILRSRGAEFEEVDGAPAYYLRRVTGLGFGEVWITAWGGNLVHVAGDTVTPYPAFSEHRLEGIWATLLDVPDPNNPDGGIIQVPRYYVTGVTGQVLVGP